MKPVPHPAKQAAIAACAAAAAFFCLPAGAQSPSDDMPPRLEKIDELQSQPAAPSISASSAASAPSTQASEPSPSGRQIIEKRERGQFTSIEVRSGERSYYIDPGEEPGTVVPGDAQSGNTRTPQWKIFEFDLKRPVDPANNGTQPAPAAPPTPVK